MNRIKELREEKKMTQIRLSTELGVTQETISAYEIGKHYPSVKSLLLMAELFHSSTDYILGLSNLRSPVKTGNLSNQELSALALFQRLDSTQREKAIAYMQGMLE